MKLPNFKRLYYNDFPKEAQEIVEQLSYTINSGFESVYNALNKNLSIRDNFLQTVRDITIIVDPNGIPIGTTTFTVDNTNPIDGTQVIRALNQTNNAIFPNAGIFLSYNQSGNKITISNVTGLPANNTFSLRVIAYLT